MWANPFDSARFGHRGAFLLFEDWLTDRMPRRRLIRLGYGDDEIEALARRRRTMVASLPSLRGRHLQCWCPLTVNVCHAAVLLSLANA
ncbi:DUF4326 domain-containing protein [Sphingomonas sp. Leaf29]|uniref:DUF4326 domain-containing protein n=1 Tax=Sphingomonas sp. Leaf29 TaxID=1736212 RepID=UPI003FA73789